METVKIFCKGNRRKRGEQIVSVCGHIVKKGEYYEEDAYRITSEGSSVELELMAMMNALLDQEALENLNKEMCLELYVCSPIIYKVLKEKEEISTLFIEEGKCKACWEEVHTLINQCGKFKVYCMDKKYRQAEEIEVKECMAKLNKLVCEQANLMES